MKHIVVTGAAGYIGGVVCKVLKENGYKVTSVDLKPTYPLYTDDHWANTCFSSDLFLKHIVEENVDAIFHLAAFSLLGPSVTNPLPYFINNAGRTAEMLDHLTDSGWNGKIVFSSTAATYGAQSYRVIEESPQNPINPYGLSKLHAEQILEETFKAHGISSVIFRYFNVAGSYDDVGQDGSEPHILTKMSKAADSGEVFSLYGNDYDTRDGTCIRDYVHVRDIAQAHLLALDILDEHEGCLKFNLGKGRGISNQELVLAFKDLGDEDLQYKIVDPRPGDPPFLVADSSKFTVMTGYLFPHSDLYNIITSHYEYYKHDWRL